MLKLMLSRQLDRFQRTWSYDASYLRRLLAVSSVSLLKFSLVSSMAPRDAAPPAALAAAEIVATLSEDCGPCVQLVVDMAAAAGVAPEVLRAILSGDQDAMGQDAGIAWRYARATLALGGARPGSHRARPDDGQALSDPEVCSGPWRNLRTGGRGWPVDGSGAE